MIEELLLQLLNFPCRRGRFEWKARSNEFVYVDDPHRFVSYQTQDISRGIPGMMPGEGSTQGQGEESLVEFTGIVEMNEITTEIEDTGNGPLDAFYNALLSMEVFSYEFISYDQHAFTTGSDLRAIAVWCKHFKKHQ